MGRPDPFEQEPSDREAPGPGALGPKPLDRDSWERDSWEREQRSLTGAFAAAKLTVEELWLRYFALGGDAGKVEIEAYLSGLMPLPTLQHNILAHAINERLDELGPPPRAHYRSDADENG